MELCFDLEIRYRSDLSENLSDFFEIFDLKKTPKGSVKCILCDENEDPKSVYYHDGIKSSFWVFSNFDKHLKKTHNLVAKKTPKTTPKNMNIDTVDTQPQSIQVHKHTLVSGDKDDSPNAIQPMDTHSQKFVEIKEEQSLNGMNDSVEFLGVVSRGLGEFLTFRIDPNDRQLIQIILISIKIIKITEMTAICQNECEPFLSILSILVYFAAFQ